MKIPEMKSNGPKLFLDFPPVSTNEWEEKIFKDLKGADYDRKLTWNTGEGFKVKPYYRNEDLTELGYLDVFPGDFPFVRGENLLGNEWLIRQDIKVEDYQKDNKKILDILMRGINSLGIIVDPSKKPAITDIEKLLENVFADQVELNYCCGDYALELVEITLQLVKKYNRNLEKIRGSVAFDPLAYFTLNGKFRKSEQETFDNLAKIIEAARYLPHFSPVTVNGSIFKNAGSTIVEELAFTMAIGNDYLLRLTDTDLTVNEIAPSIRFNFAVGSNYFMEIARLRAARVLWAHIVNAYGPDDVDVTKTFIHTETSDWNMTIYDPYVNMLRTTTEAMSAIIGGIDSLTVKGYDAAFETPTAFAERIARNQQLLLKEESYLDKVVDPSAGSYYIENLTNSIVNEAWKLFLEIQDKGGYLEAFKKGFVQNMVKESANGKDMAIASRKLSILGTNQYPNPQEHLDKDIASLTSKNQKEPEGQVEKLIPYRGAQAFEELRYQTDKYSQKNKRPVVFMLTMGNLAMRRARAQFSGNFFACAGYEIIDNNGFDTVEQGVKAALDSNSDIVVLCSSDDEYSSIAIETYKMLKGKVIVVVAGYPKDIIEDLKAKGITRFIHLKTNVLETLKEFQKELSIDKL